MWIILKMATCGKIVTVFRTLLDPARDFQARGIAEWGQLRLPGSKL